MRCSVPCLNNVQRVRMIWCLIWIKYEPMYPKKRCVKDTRFLKAIVMKNSIRIEKDRSYLMRLSRSVCLGDIKSALPCWNNQGLDSGTVGHVFKMFFCRVARVLPTLVTKSMVQIGQCYATHVVVHAVFQSYYVPEEIIPRLEDYDEQKDIIQNISVTETTIKRVLHAKNLGSITL